MPKNSSSFENIDIAYQQEISTPEFSFKESLSELQLLPQEKEVVVEGLKSARENQDFLLVQYLESLWQELGQPAPREISLYKEELEVLYKAGKVNKKFDTQLDEETTGLSQKEVLLKKISRAREQNENLKAGKTKLIVVVIPSYYAEKENLPRTLESLHQQEFDDPVIVVVSNNNSPENNQIADVGKIGEELGANAAVGSVPGNIASARRKGCDRAMVNVENLENLIIAGIDSDTIAKPGYLNEIQQAFEDEHAVAWTDLVDFGENVPSEVKEVENWINGWLVKTKKEVDACHMPGFVHAVRADVYKAVGGHTLDYVGAEDINLAEKIYEYMKQQKALEGQDLQMKLSETKSTITSPRKFLDEEGYFSEGRKTAILKQWTDFGKKAARTEEISGHVARSRKIRERLSSIRSLFDQDGIRVVTDELIRRRKLDADYQRMVNLPELKKAILSETQTAREELNTTFNREVTELQETNPTLEIPPESNLYLMGEVYRDETSEMSVIIKRSLNPDTTFKYTGVQIERKFAKDDQPETFRIYSWAEIDPSNEERLTQVFWADEDQYFHPDDQYPRVAALLFNTHYDMISKIPTEQVDIEIRPQPKQEEISEKFRFRLYALNQAVARAKSERLESHKIEPVERILRELEIL